MHNIASILSFSWIPWVRNSKAVQWSRGQWRPSTQTGENNHVASVWNQWKTSSLICLLLGWHDFNTGLNWECWLKAYPRPLHVVLDFLLHGTWILRRCLLEGASRKETFQDMQTDAERPFLAWTSVTFYLQWITKATQIQESV